VVTAADKLREADALLARAWLLIEAAYQETPQATSARTALAGASDDVSQARYQLKYVIEEAAQP
jgi:hypothetical protein